MTARIIMITAAMSGAAAVLLGAFGAHGAGLSGDALATWKTASLYHFVHTLALLALAASAETPRGRALTVTAAMFLAGIVLFSGSLYGLALFGWSWLGPVTPLGGVCFIIGWCSLAYGWIRS